MRNPLLRGSAIPLSFKELAGRVIETHLSSTPLTERMLQEAFQQFLEWTHWQDCSIETNRPGRGDLTLARKRSPYFVVELKRAARLQSAHVMQGRDYSARHMCPCIVTNGIEYKMILAQDRRAEVSVARLPVTVTAGRHVIVELGEFGPKAANNALERLLADLFTDAAEGPESVSKRVTKLVTTALRRAEALPAPAFQPRGFLPSGHQ